MIRHRNFVFFSSSLAKAHMQLIAPAVGTIRDRGKTGYTAAPFCYPRTVPDPSSSKYPKTHRKHVCIPIALGHTVLHFQRCRERPLAVLEVAFGISEKPDTDRDAC